MATSPNTAEFTYQTQLVIYKFISLVPSSVQATPSDDEARSLGTNCVASDDAELRQRRESDKVMFNELKDAVAARQHQKEESAKTQLLNNRMLKELKAKVEERDRHGRDAARGDMAVPPMTIIRKKNAVKAVMSPPIGILTGHACVAGGHDIYESPLLSSTLAVMDTSSVTASPACQLSENLDYNESVEQLSRSVSSVSDASSTYVDIYQFEDIKPLVSAGVLPSVAEPLLEEVQHGIEELELSHSRSVEDEIDGSGNESDSNSQPYGAVKECHIIEAAEMLRCLGDQVQAEFGDQIDGVMQQIDWSLPRSQLLVQLRRSIEELMQNLNNSWLRVALAMLLCGRMVHSMLLKGFKGINDVVKFTAQIIEDYAAQYIIDHGGWSSISELGETTICVKEEDLPVAAAESSSIDDGKSGDVIINNNDVDQIDGRTVLNDARETVANGTTLLESPAGSSDVFDDDEQQFSWLPSSSIKPSTFVGIALLTAIGFFLLRRFRRS